MDRGRWTTARSAARLRNRSDTPRSGTVSRSRSSPLGGDCGGRGSTVPCTIMPSGRARDDIPNNQARVVACGRRIGVPWDGPEASRSSGDLRMSTLILDSLQIEQYRLFEKLVIPRLGRVNLITGKNNVGKTSILEALRLYATRAEPPTLLQILV